MRLLLVLLGLWRGHSASLDRNESRGSSRSPAQRQVNKTTLKTLQKHLEAESLILDNLFHLELPVGVLCEHQEGSKASESLGWVGQQQRTIIQALAHSQRKDGYQDGLSNSKKTMISSTAFFLPYAAVFVRAALNKGPGRNLSFHPRAWQQDIFR